MAVGTANPSKAFFQIATYEKGSHAPIDHRSPEAVLGLKSLAIDLAERLKMLIHQPPQIGSTRITRPIQGQWFGAGKRHDQAAHPRRGAHGAGVEHRVPRRLSEGPAAMDNREKVYIGTHIDILPVHAFWLLRWRRRLTNRCGRVRYAAWLNTRCGRIPDWSASHASFAHESNRRRYLPNSLEKARTNRVEGHL